MLASITQCRAHKEYAQYKQQLQFYVEFVSDVSKTLNDAAHLLGRMTSELYESEQSLALLRVRAEEGKA